MAQDRPGRPSPQPRPGSPWGGRVAQAEMRASNMGLILRHLRTHGGRSRARLASETGLSKATTSSLIADLADRGLVREGAVVRGGTIGRPGQTVTLDGRGVVGVGLEISADYAALMAVTLSGTVVRESITPLDAAHLTIGTVLDRAAAQLERAVGSLRMAGAHVVGITVAAPGIIDYDTGKLRFAPNLGWRGVPLAAGLAERLGPDAPPIRVENDAKLAALAEFDRVAPQGVLDLLYLTGEVGIGAGIVSAGRLVRGHAGFSGEVGHLPLDPTMTPCTCGRRGCWETVVGLAAFLSLVADEGDSLRDPTRPLEDRLLTLAERARAGDARVLQALTTIGDRLALGLGILVDVLNPRMVVLGGYYAFFGEQLLPHLTAALDARLLDEGGSAILASSELGLVASALGGALFALEDVFSDPTIVLPEA